MAIWTCFAFKGYHPKERHVTYKYLGGIYSLPVRVDVIPRFPWLRERLDSFRTDDWPYNPHLTTPDLTEFSGEIDRFCLMDGDEIVMEWGM